MQRETTQVTHRLNQTPHKKPFEIFFRSSFKTSFCRLLTLSILATFELFHLAIFFFFHLFYSFSGFTGPWPFPACLTFRCFYCMWPGFLLPEVGQDVALGSCAFNTSATHRRWEKVHPANESHVAVAEMFYT